MFRRSGPFATLPSLLLDEVFRQLEPCAFDAGDALMREGDPGDGLLVLLSGSAHASLHEHGDVALGRFGTGDVVGEMALVTREPRTADVIADTPVTALRLPVPAFDRLALRHPVLAKVLTEVVAERLGQHTSDGLGGKTIDRYVIQRCIGRGGMAVVYEARDAESGEPVALKMMSHRLIYEVGALARFHQEAELAQSLQHPNIASLQRLFPAYNTYFLVMELCDGIDLERLVGSRGALPEAQVRPILGQLASALDYLHGRGMIHRDLKPSNVMLNRSGTVKLTDFGLAMPVLKLDDQTRLTPSVLEGTPGFMAPEQLTSTPLDGRADIYALACFAFVLLTGRPLFRGKSLLEIVQEKMNVQLPSAAAIGGGISSELHAFLASALRPVREDRPDSARALLSWAAPVEITLLNPA